MIQIFEAKGPLGETSGKVAVATLTEAMAKIRAAFPALLEATASVGPDNVLTLRLRVSGAHRWDVKAKARKIATSMLWRVKIPAAAGSIDLISTAPAANSLTKGQGRSVVNHRARGSKAKAGVDSAVTPEDPS